MFRPLVLIVDHHDDTRNILRILLEYCGYDVAEAAGARAALRVALERLPRMILTELSMPSLSGFELLALLRREPALAQIPVLAVCGDDLEPESRAAGFRGYIRKPLHIPGLLALLRDVTPLDADLTPLDAI